MDCHDRLYTALGGDRPDRVPVLPKIWVDLACRLTGRDLLSVMGDPESAMRTIVEAAIARIEAAGHTIAQSGSMTGGVRFVYFDTELHPGTVFEVSNLAGPLAVFPQMIADAARDWDGSEPIRVIEM